MVEEKMKKGSLGFNYERKRIKKDKKLPPLCADYQPVRYSDNCEKAKFCKNATYCREGEADGVCYGGTKSSEIKDRKKYLDKKAFELK